LDHGYIYVIFGSIRSRRAPIREKEAELSLNEEFPELDIMGWVETPVVLQYIIKGRE
jgi:hypothetical protein